MRLNRTNLDFRNIDVTFKNGVCYWYQGNTKVAASIKSTYYKGISYYYNVNLTADTTNNIVYRSKYRRELEITSLGNNIFRSIIPSTSNLKILTNVIEMDGSTRVCCYNAATMALMYNKVPILSQLCCLSVGVVDNEILIDLDYKEDSKGDCDILFMFLQPSRELLNFSLDGLITRQNFVKAYYAAKQKSKLIYDIQNETITKYGTK